MTTKRPGMERLSGDDIAPLEALFDEAYPDAMRDLSTVIFAQLMAEADLRAAFDTARLAELAMSVTESIGDELGGRSFYLVKGVKYRASLRDQRIYKEHNGRNTGELALRYHLSEQRIYQIVARMTRQRYARSQGELFA